MSENICVINAQSGIGTSSPQISQFSHNCDCIKFIINKDLTGFALCLISSINGDVSVLTEGEYLSKTYNEETKETSVLWYPNKQITNESGCVLYQLAAYEAEGKNTIWYSKEGRLIVSDSIDTNDFSAKQVGSEPNLVTQLITKIKSLELDIISLESSKVDKEDAEEEKEKLQKLNSDFNETKENFENNISSLGVLIEENKGEETYDPESIKSQSGKAVAQAIAGIVNSAPETLDTLEELAKALGNDPNFATTIMTLLGKKVDRLEKPKDAVVYVETKAGNTTGIPYATRPTRYTIPQRVETGALLVKEIPTLLNEAVSKKYVDTQADKKVDKLAGKGLSSNDFTDEYKMLIDENNYKIGDLGDLTTGVTETLVGAISETYDFACENNYNMGMLSDLITVHNDTFVDAINEIYEDTHQKPITTIPTTLSSNKQYNFGEVTSLSLAFPTSAEDGDVVYLTFFSGDSETSLTIDTTNTCDIEVVPETNTGYEIFGKYNGLVWIVNYSEYIVSEG